MQIEEIIKKVKSVKPEISREEFLKMIRRKKMELGNYFTEEAIAKILVAVGSKELHRKLISTKKGDFIEFHYVKPNFQDPVSKRVAAALNVVLSKVRLEEYDYLLRVDADTVLPRRFLEENLKVNADCVAEGGYAMLIKVSSFIKYFNGRFAVVEAEDSYIGFKLLSRGRIVKSYVLPPKMTRKSGAYHSWKYYFERGIARYKFGYGPIHIIGSPYRDIRNVFAILGYFFAFLKRMERHDFARWVFKTQFKRLLKGKTRLW